MSSPRDSSLPVWAITQAEAALKVGQTMPEIEKSLMAKGLAKEMASAVVTAVLEGRVLQPWKQQAKARRNNWIHRVLSAIAGVACLLLIYRLFGGLPRRSGTAGIIILVACIWFPDVKKIWPISRRYDTTDELPVRFVRWSAWFLLVLVFIVVLYLYVAHKT